MNQFFLKGVEEGLKTYPVFYNEVQRILQEWKRSGLF